MKPEELTRENYHSTEANQAYMSNSQYGNFIECPARAVATLDGAWDEGEKKAYLMGGYVDCALLTPLDLEEWWSSHLSAMIETGLLSKAQKTMGAKLSEIEYADFMIKRAQDDKLFMKMLEGTQQRIVVGEMFGVPWKIMVDSLNIEERRITDLKTSKDISKKSWFSTDDIFDQTEGTAGLHNYKGYYFDEFRYFRQFAVYRELVSKQTNISNKEWLLIMATISKKKPTGINPLLTEDKCVNIELRHMSDEKALSYELETVKKRLPQIMKWKEKKEVAPGCGKCAFCIAYKKAQLIPTTSVIWA